MVGCFAFAMAGHDKGKIYIITKQEGDIVYLCDGVHKLLEKPKRKNIKHIQIIKKEKPLGYNADEEIKQSIKMYLAKMEE